MLRGRRRSIGTLLVLGHLWTSISLTHALVTCTTTLECEMKVRQGSVCNENGICTNPFQKGCLRAMLGEEKALQYTAMKYRACNSDDHMDSSSEEDCSTSSFSYPEIRISNGNWESSMFLAWMYQIFLSEFLGVPATIETSTIDSIQGSFYDDENHFIYANRTYNWDGLRIPLNTPGGTCPRRPKRERSSSTTSSDSINDDDDPTASTTSSCCHVIPEVWPSQVNVIRQQEEEGIIMPPSSLDVVGKLGIYVPTFTAKRDLSLTSFLGLTVAAGGDNEEEELLRRRHKVAQAFKLPVTFSEYCTTISPTQCINDTTTIVHPDDHYSEQEEEEEGNRNIFNTTTNSSTGHVGVRIASRPPLDDDEGSKYYIADGIYNGYFRDSIQNNCTEFPTTCVGHLIDGRCDWSTLAQSQIYWNHIPMESFGPKGGYGWYEYWSMVEIWHAANATKNNVMMWWWSTDWMLQSFLGTDGEFVKVDLPTPTLSCIQNRVSEEGKCSMNRTDQIGYELGSCDYEPAVLLTAMSSALKKQNEEEINPAKKCAAIDLMERFHTTDVVIDYLLKEWYERDMDRFGYDPRDVICTWIANNVDDLKNMLIPDGYPRQMLNDDHHHHSKKTTLSNHNTAAFIVARVLSYLTGLSSICSVLLVSLWRKRKVIRYAQPDFLYLVLMGFLLLSGAAYVYTLTPKTINCILRPWFWLLGSSLELMPLIVKVSAILKATKEANHFRRVKMSRIQLLGAVFALLGIITIFLIVWTVVDPPQRQEDLVLLTEDEQRRNPVGGYYVEIQVQCSSKSSIWVVAGLSWQLILLFWATIVAYQTRNLRTDFNESQFLGFMIYTHFMFVFLRFLLVVLLSDSFTPSFTMLFTSYLLSLDTFITFHIYFTPKFYKAIFDENAANTSPTRSSSSFLQQSIRRWTGGGTTSSDHYSHRHASTTMSTTSGAMMMGTTRNSSLNVDKIRRTSSSGGGAVEKLATSSVSNIEEMADVSSKEPNVVLGTQQE